MPDATADADDEARYLAGLEHLRRLQHELDGKLQDYWALRVRRTIMEYALERGTDRAIKLLQQEIAWIESLRGVTQ
jgi:hypothetical protein